MRGSFIVFSTVILSLLGCTFDAKMDAQLVQSFREIGPDPTVYFCKQDNCTHQLNELFKHASQSIHCALFDLEEDLLVHTLTEKSAVLDVRVVVDNKHDPRKFSVAKRDTRSELMHNKFCIIDKEIVWTGSYNPTPNGNTKNENNAVVIISAFAAQNYEDEFNELWNGVFGRGEQTKRTPIIHNDYQIETLFCPEDGCEGRVIELINEAEHSIYFMHFSFTSESIADALLFTQGVHIQGVIDSSGAASPYGQFTRLKEFGVDVVKDSNPGKLHHKVFIIDNSTVLLGSYNPSTSGAWKNDENILVIHHASTTHRFVEEFFRLRGFGQT